MLNFLCPVFHLPMVVLVLAAYHLLTAVLVPAVFHPPMVVLDHAYNKVEVNDNAYF